MNTEPSTMEKYTRDHSPPPAPTPGQPHIKALERGTKVNILGVEYRVHNITHGGKKLQLRRIK